MEIRQIPIMLLLLVVLSAAGCRSTVFRAAELPGRFAARPTTDVQALDLSRLAMPGSGSEQINEGDTLSMTVVTGAEGERPQPWSLRVEPDGAVDVPLVGRVQVAGMKLQRAQSVIREASVRRGLYRQPSIALAMSQPQENRITVMGAVADPGTFKIPSGNSDLLSAVMAAGGLAEDADAMIEVRNPIPPTPVVPADRDRDKVAAASYLDGGSNASLTRGGSDAIQTPFGSETFTLNLVSATNSTAPQPVVLRDGAVVTVKRRPPRYVHVLGLVKKPDQIELPPNQDLRVLAAIAQAGGVSVSIADKVVVIRQTQPNEPPITIELSITDAKHDGTSNLLLADGDVVSVEETAVTLAVGAVNKFLRIGLTGSLSLF